MISDNEALELAKKLENSDIDIKQTIEKAATAGYLGEKHFYFIQHFTICFSNKTFFFNTISYFFLNFPPAIVPARCNESQAHS